MYPAEAVWPLEETPSGIRMDAGVHFRMDVGLEARDPTSLALNELLRLVS